MVLKGFFININMKPKIKVNGPQGVVELFTESSLVGKLPAQKQPKIVFRKHYNTFKTSPNHCTDQKHCQLRKFLFFHVQNAFGSNLSHFQLIITEKDGTI